MSTPNPSPPSRRSSGRAWVILAIVLMVIVLTLLLVLWSPWQEAAAQEQPGGPEALPVDVVVVEQATLEQTVRGIGSLRASQMVDIRPEIAGIIRSIEFTEGGFVEQGQVLFTLDDEKLVRQVAARQAAVQAAEVRVANARNTFNRQEQLLERGIAAEEEFERAQAELDGAIADLQRASAELELAQAQLQETQILAPFSGYMSARLVDRGAYVSAGDTVATLYQVDPIELEFYIGERFAPLVQAGQPISVTVSALPETAFSGEIDFVSPAVREATRDFLVKATIPNPEGTLRPGTFATAVVTVDVNENRPVIPEEALVATRQGYMVFVVEDGVASSREVEVGMRRDGLAEVTSGLTPGERVVRRGHLRLSGGEAVRAVEAETPPAPTATAGAD